MEWNLPRLRRETDLVTCSLCLSVRRGSTRIEAEEVITQLRSYESDTTPRLLPGVCDHCADAILDRRARTEDAIAA